MRAVTVNDNTTILNMIPVAILEHNCKVGNIHLTIENGAITRSEQLHRDYVSVWDGRNMYCDERVNNAKTESKRLLNSLYGLQSVEAKPKLKLMSMYGRFGNDI